MRVGAVECLLALWLLRAAALESLLLSLDGLPLDDEGRLAANHLLYSASCPAALVASLADERGVREPRAAAPAVMRAFADSACSLVCLQRGVPDHLIAHTLPYLVVSAEDEGFPENGSDWASATCDAAELGLVNNLDREAHLFWVHPATGKEKHSGVVAAGGQSQMLWCATHLGHAFVVRDAAGEELLRVPPVQHDTFLQVGPSPPSEGGPDFLDHVEQRSRELLLREWEGKDNVTRTFTDMGFGKGRLPRDVWASMLAFYHNIVPGRVSSTRCVCRL